MIGAYLFFNSQEALFQKKWVSEVEIEYSFKYNSFILSLRCHLFFSFLAVMEPDIDDMDDETEYDFIKEVPKPI